MIEKRGLPLSAVVALDAGSDSVLYELFPMRVFVALLTLAGSALEIDMKKPGFQVRRLVAVDARGCLVRAKQGEVGQRMVEAAQLPPSLGRMAGFATGLAVCDAQHAFAELAAMRIFVATCAAEIIPAINRSGRSEGLAQFVAIAASGGYMPAGQGEFRSLVPREIERRRRITLQRMALLTGVEIGSGGELRGMLVGVAVGAMLEADLEQGFAAFRNVALVALDLRVFSLERIGGLSMLFHSEIGRFKTCDAVARGTLPAIAALRELTHMGIFMTVHALGE